MKTQNFLLMDKAIFFKEPGILAIADPHLGYEQMLNQQGIEIPFNQLQETKKELKKIMNKIEKEKFKIKKIIVLGDLKHNFPFDRPESYEIFDFIKFLEKFFSEKDIILIKGNHEKIILDREKYKNFFIDKKENIAFIHGDLMHKKVLAREIKTIVMGHLHPAVILREKNGVKREKYKCFLIGRYKNKKIIILPSFFIIKEGSDISETEDKNKFIIPKNVLEKFNVFVVGRDKIYDFGKLRGLRS